MDSTMQRAVQTEVQDLLNRALLFQALAIAFQRPCTPTHRDTVLAALHPGDEHLLPDARIPWQRDLAKARRGWREINTDELTHRYLLWTTSAAVPEAAEPDCTGNTAQQQAAPVRRTPDPKVTELHSHPEAEANCPSIPAVLTEYGRFLLQEAHARARDWATRVRMARHNTAELLENHGPGWLIAFSAEQPEQCAAPYIQTARLARTLILSEARRLRPVAWTEWAPSDWTGNDRQASGQRV